MGEILNSPKGVKSGVAERVAPVTIHAIIIGSQSYVTVCEQILQHM